MDLKIAQESYLREVPLLKRKARKERLTSFVRDFFQGQTAFSLEQKAMIGSRLNSIIRQVLANAGLRHIPLKEKTLKRFVEELKEVVVHVNTIFKLPEYQGTSPFAKGLIETLLQGDTKGLKLPLAPLLSGRDKGPHLTELRNYLQTVFDALFVYAEKLTTQDLWTEGFIGHLLSYYTFFDPPKDAHLALPIFTEGKWQKLDYKVEKILLTPSWMGSPMVAFGLIGENAPPLLLFKGTSYPADEGFGLQLLSDINPAASVGRYAFELGKKRVQKWLRENVQACGKKARVFGVSLGGALTEHTAVRFPELIEVAFPYCAPRLLPLEVSSWNRRYRRKENLPRVTCFRNKKDVVSDAGLALGKGWEVHEVVGNSSSFFLLAHIESYFARDKHLILRIKKDIQPIKQKCLAITHLLLSLPLFVLGTLLYALITLAKKIYLLAKGFFKP